MARKRKSKTRFEEIQRKKKIQKEATHIRKLRKNKVNNNHLYIMENYHG